MRRIAWGVIFASTAFVGAATVAARQTPVPAQPGAARYVLVFGYGGEFTTVDASTGAVVARRVLSRVEGLGAHLPTHPPADANSADQWLVGEVVSDLRKQRLYLTVPLTSADAPDGSANSIVMSLNAPLLQLNGVVSVPGRPTLVLDSDNDRLFVSYAESTDADRVIGRLMVFNASNLARVLTFSDETTVARFERGEQMPASLLSEGASMASGGSVLVDGLRKVIVSSEALAVEPINVATILTAPQQQALARFYRRDPSSGRQWLPYSFVKSARDLAVFTVASQESSEMALLTVDAMAPRVIALAVMPAGRVHITSDGTVGIIDFVQRASGSAAAGASAVEKAGRLMRIDLATGRPIDEVTDPSLRGGADDGVVCVGSANDPVVYAARDSLALVHFGAAPRVTRTAAATRGAPQTRCGWSGQ